MPTNDQVSIAAGLDEAATRQLLARLCDTLGFVPHPYDDLDCAVWSSPVDVHIVVTFHREADVRLVGRAARLRDVLCGRLRLRAQDDLTCLAIVPDTARWQVIERAVIVRRALDYVRVVTVDGLAALAELVASGALTHRHALLVLRPAGAFADAMIALAAGTSPDFAGARALLNSSRPAPPGRTRP